MILCPNRLPESERVCPGICTLEPYYKSELIVYRKKTPVLLDQKLLFIVLFMALLVICNFLNYTKII